MSSLGMGEHFPERGSQRRMELTVRIGVSALMGMEGNDQG
jgi:hypothetical protein